MKIISKNNKVYQYDYITTNLHANQHKAIRELAKKHKLKGIMFLDPFAAVVVESTEMNNRLFITEQAICKALEEYKTNIKQSILQDYLKIIHQKQKKFHYLPLVHLSSHSLRFVNHK